MTFREFLDVYRGYRIPRFKLIEHRNWWFTFSGILVVLSLMGIFWRGFNFSIDFEGGAQLSYPLHTGETVGDIESTLGKYGLTGAIPAPTPTSAGWPAMLSGTEAHPSVPARAYWSSSPEISSIRASVGWKRSVSKTLDLPWIT